MTWLTRWMDRTEHVKRFWNEQAAWSQATFGPDDVRGPIGPLKHLEKEAREAQADPTDLKEFVDCLFLTFDSTRRAGFTLEQLLDGAFAKLAENKQRNWPDWRTLPLDSAIEHKRESPDPQQLPYCVKCGQGRKRGEKFTELTFKHDHCPSDDACEVVSAKMPQEQAQ